jgi:hypothetical protein
VLGSTVFGDVLLKEHARAHASDRRPHSIEYNGEFAVEDGRKAGAGRASGAKAGGAPGPRIKPG